MSKIEVECNTELLKRTKLPGVVLTSGLLSEFSPSKHAREGVLLLWGGVRY